MSNEVSKRDRFTFNRAQAAAGRQMWNKTGQQGRVAHSSMDAEKSAPKTWIRFMGSAKGETEAMIECEIYMNGRASDPTEAIGMLHGMCPKCGETFIVREDAKSMSLGWVSYGKAKGHLKTEWERHCREALGRRTRDDDQIAVVSSPERWACDYCRSFCVRVTDSVAITDMSGTTQIIIDQGQRTNGDGKVVPALSIRESEIVL